MDASTQNQKPRRRLWIAIGLTPVVVSLAAIGGVLGYTGSSEPMEWDLVVGATMAILLLCAIAWGSIGAWRLAHYLNRRAQSLPAREGQWIQTPELTREILSQSDIQCRGCGYNLRGLVANSCPECQRVIRLHVADADPVRPFVWLTRLALGACMVRVSFVVLEFVLLLRMYRGMPSLGGPRELLMVSLYFGRPVVAVIGLVAVVIASITWLRAPAAQPRDRARWRVLRLSVGILAALTVLDVAAYGLQWLWW